MTITVLNHIPEIAYTPQTVFLRVGKPYFYNKASFYSRINTVVGNFAIYNLMKFKRKEVIFPKITCIFVLEIPFLLTSIHSHKRFQILGK